RDNSYSSLGTSLGPEIGPNAESWFFRTLYLPLRNLRLSLSVTLVREGENFFDASGKLINVGGDFLQPHRPSDPLERFFLDGILIKTRRINLITTYEVRNQIWLEAWYEFESMNNTSLKSSATNHTFGGRLRMEF
ncbi:MAG: hypothetical protein HW412_1376, partial [Bacteroidetes bacterium]|nr:hypothetical protein [Bacteroidota bacterium]